MKRYIILVLLVFFSGCLLPISSTRRLSPLFHGHVYDASTGQPLSGVHVTLSAFKGGMAIKETITDTQGSFSIIAEEESRWTMFPPPETAAHGVVTFVQAGYEPLTVERGWFGVYRPDQEEPLALKMKKSEPNKRVQTTAMTPPSSTMHLAPLSDP
jgi:hypothetical protein